MDRMARRPLARGRGRRSWWIGIDLGGTWLRAVACDASGRRRTVTARAPDLDALPASLLALWRRWNVDGPQVRRLVVASRWGWTAAERRRQQRLLRGLAARLLVLSDAEAAYHAALGDGPGVLLLAGTGSMALGCDARGHWVRAGGLGPLLGDEGSSFWVGREWLRTGTGPASFAAMRRILGSAHPVARIAALAAEVLRQAAGGSPRARLIVRRGQQALADLLLQTGRRLRTRAPVAVSWGGSLLDVERYRAGVWRAVRRRGLRIRPTLPRESAAEAALRIATGSDRGDRARRPLRLIPRRASSRSHSPSPARKRTERGARRVNP